MEKKKRKVFSKKHKMNISLAKKGWKPSKELKLKWSLQRKGKPKSKSHRKNIKFGAFKRWSKKEEREKQSKRRKGKKFTKEHCNNIKLNHHDVSGKNNPMYGNPRKDLQIKFKGEGNPMFNNWSSREPYGKEFSPELKKQIRKRDNYVCQECMKHQEKLKITLNVHHIDYNKQNNSFLNLISLCINCHTKTNSNRKHWTRYFKNIMTLRELFNPENILIFNEKK